MKTTLDGLFAPVYEGNAVRTRYDKLFKKTTINLDDVLNRIQVLGNKVPRIILGIGPCRTGTTVSLRIFGAVGVPSYWHPIKSLARYELTETHGTWDIPETDVIYAKETLGPYTETESTLNSFSVLIGLFENLGVSPAKFLHVILFGRKPEDVLFSWRKALDGKKMTDEELEHTFSLSFKTAEYIRQQAVSQSIPLTHFVYESARSPGVFRELFRRVGIRKNPILSSWKNLPEFGSTGSNIFELKRPEQYKVKSEVHGKARNADGFTFFEGHGHELSSPNRAFASQFDEIYEEWKNRSFEDLGIIPH